jgi:DNA-binding MarR family transcriptional regulator
MDDSKVVDALAQLSWHVQARIGDAAAEHGISASQLRLLGILRDRKPEMQALASYLRLDKSSVTGLVARAEARGLVERVPGETDRRRVTVRLTAAGHAVAGEVEAAVYEALAPTLTAMPVSEREALVRLVTAVVPSLD